MNATPLPAATLSLSLGDRKRALEDLLWARRLQADEPPLRGEDRRLRPLPTGIAEVDALVGGGFPRGALSEIHGPASSGRTGVLLGLLARTTRAGALAALVDPLDRLDPGSAARGRVRADPEDLARAALVATRGLCPDGVEGLGSAAARPQGFRD